MLWERKGASPIFEREAPVLSKSPELEKTGTDGERAASLAAPSQLMGTVLGPSTIVRGELSVNEDLLIEGNFEGSLQLQDHCVTVGPQATVMSDIDARQAIIQGHVKGDISAREKIEIRQTGHVVGDLAAPGVVIETGAYYKGKIDILREESRPQPLEAQSTLV